MTLSPFDDFGQEVHYWQNGHIATGVVTEKMSVNFWRIDGAAVPVSSIISAKELQAIKAAAAVNTPKATNNKPAKKPPPPPPDEPVLPDTYLLTETPDDEGHAQCVAHLYADIFLQCDALGWLFYNGRYWQREGAEGELDRAVIETLKARRIEAVKADNEKLIKATKPTAANVRNCKYLFRSLVPTTPGCFDADLDLLNCKNGVVNLRTGDIAPHSPAQRFTYCVPIAYVPGADDAAWVDWLYHAIIPEGETDDGRFVELASWIQMAVGYSLTGRTNEQCMFYLQGPTRGGKGLFLQILGAVLGKPLAHAVDFDAFTARRGGDSQGFDLAPLKAARLVTASESNRTGMLNAKVVKAITGNDGIYCAFKHHDFFEYTPRFKIWLSSNFTVKADAGDDALWGRLRIITFPNGYLEREDYALPGKLQANLPGILAWAVAGAREWYKRLDTNVGLGRLAIIKETIQAHRNENDTVGQFIADRCNVGEGLYVQGSTLTHWYNEFCKDNNLLPLGGRRLSEALRRMGFEYGLKRTNDTVAKGWFGLELL